jgi:hypothetical protein
MGWAALVPLCTTSTMLWTKVIPLLLQKPMVSSAQGQRQGIVCLSYLEDPTPLLLCVLAMRRPWKNQKPNVVPDFYNFVFGSLSWSCRICVWGSFLNIIGMGKRQEGKGIPEKIKVQFHWGDKLTSLYGWTPWMAAGHSFLLLVIQCNLGECGLVQNANVVFFGVDSLWGSTTNNHSKSCQAMPQLYYTYRWIAIKTKRKMLIFVLDPGGTS